MLHGIRSCVFDAYGTLFDYASAAARRRDELNHGDAMLVDRGVERVVDEASYVFDQEGALFVKMIERLVDGGISVKPRNPQFGPPQILTREQASRITVFGRVRWRGGLL